MISEQQIQQEMILALRNGSYRDQLRFAVDPNNNQVVIVMMTEDNKDCTYTMLALDKFTKAISNIMDAIKSMDADTVKH